MKFFKKFCNHHWVVKQRSNVLQCDNMGYPRMLCICKCSKCETYDQFWVDISENALKELETGRFVLLKWE